MEILLVIVVVIAATVLLTWYARKKMAQSWTGVVSSVHRYEQPHDPQDSQSLMEDWMRVVIRTDAGKKIKLQFRKTQFDQLYPTGLVEGDRVEKAAGAFYPSKTADPAQG